MIIKTYAVIFISFFISMSGFSQTLIEVGPISIESTHQDSIYLMEGGYISDEQLISGKYIFVPKNDNSEEEIISYIGHVAYVKCAEGKIVFSALLEQSALKSEQSQYQTMLIDIDGEATSCLAIEQDPGAIKKISVRGKQLVRATGIFEF